MDNNNWRPAQDGAESAIDTGDWRTQLQNESRQRIVNKITDTLKRHLPFSGQEGLLELKKIAVRFEEKIYTAATSQSDYLRKISLKMLTMESKSQNSMANSLPSNPADAGSLGMQSQIGNQGPLLPVGQPRQQLLAQNIQNNITTTGLQDSCCLTSAMPGGGFLPQTSMPGVVQNINLQNMQSISGVSQNSVANSMGQGVSANMYANTQRQMQGRQQLMGQLGPQGNVPGLQHQPMLGTQSGNSSMQKNQHPVYIMQQSKVSMPQENQQNITPFLPSHGQHSQSAMANQQLMLQIQSQPGQLQQQQNPLHRDMQQRLQQRTLPEAPSTSSDSTAQTENGNSGDWQEEAYQKILTMKEAYMSELQEIYLKIAYKLQQHDNLPQQPKNEQVEKLKIFKTMLERIMTFLQVPKNNILPTFNEKLGGYEKQILNLLNSIRALKPGALMQQSQQLTQPQMHQPQLSQISQAQSHDNPMSSQVQSMNLQGSVNTWQQNNLTSLQHNSLSSLSGVPNASQSLMNPLQSISNLSSSQGNPLHTIPQTAVGSIQQSSSAPQQCNSNMLQHQQLKQEEQQMLQNQMTQTFRHHHMQQQLIHEQQLQQQQQRQILQQKQEQNSQMQANQMTLLHQLNDMDMKMRQQLGVKGGSLLQNQRSMYHHQQLKSGSLQCPISSMESMEWRIHGMESRIPQMEMEIIILKGENSVLQAQIIREMKIAKEQKGARVVPVLLFCFVLMVFVMVTKSSGKGKNLLALD